MSVVSVAIVIVIMCDVVDVDDGVGVIDITSVVCVAYDCDDDGVVVVDKDGNDVGVGVRWICDEYVRYVVVGDVGVATVVIAIVVVEHQ